MDFQNDNSNNNNHLFHTLLWFQNAVHFIFNHNKKNKKELNCLSPWSVEFQQKFMSFSFLFCPFAFQEPFQNTNETKSKSKGVFVKRYFDYTSQFSLHFRDNKMSWTAIEIFHVEHLFPFLIDLCNAPSTHAWLLWWLLPCGYVIKSKKDKCCNNEQQKHFLPKLSSGW